MFLFIRPWIHVGFRRNQAGQSLIASGMPWQSHLYLMLVAAKLLADSETTLQVTTWAGFTDSVTAYRLYDTTPLEATKAFTCLHLGVVSHAPQCS